MASSKVTKELFDAYRKVQLTGKYNMFMNGNKVMKLIGCNDRDTYMDILWNYKDHMKRFGVVEAFKEG